MIEAEKTYEHILFEQDGAAAYVTMNRPKKRNALSLEHMRELISVFEEIGAGREASVVILRGEGRAFCAGHDLSEMVGRDPGFYRHLFDVCCELMETIQRIPNHFPRGSSGRRAPRAPTLWRGDWEPTLRRRVGDSTPSARLRSFGSQRQRRPKGSRDAAYRVAKLRAGVPIAGVRE